MVKSPEGGWVEGYRYDALRARVAELEAQAEAYKVDLQTSTEVCNELSREVKRLVIERNEALAKRDACPECLGTDGSHMPLCPSLTKREADGFVLVPVEPTEAMLDAAVAMALQVSVSGQGGWTKYVAGLYAQMLAAAQQKKGDV
jgi:hypothetical protein